MTPPFFLTPLIEVYPTTNVRKNFVSTNFWQIFILSHPPPHPPPPLPPYCNGRGAEIIYNQIAFIFSKE